MCENSECLLLIASEDAEEVLRGAAGLLKSSDVSDEIWTDVLDALCRVGRGTWYRCRCGEVAPTRGVVDAVCEHCGEVRRLPARLSRSPWPLYLDVLRRLRPEDWFECLSAWGIERGLGWLEREAGGAYPAEGLDSDAGGASYGRKDVDARGAALSAQIRFEGGMCISRNGEIRGLSWICPEMMDSRALRETASGACLPLI